MLGEFLALRYKKHVVAVRLLFPLLAVTAASGGRKFTYTTVDMLNESGFEAYVVHPTGSSRFSWFENSTRVVTSSEIFPSWRSSFRGRVLSKLPSVGSLGQIDLLPDDILVIPETRLGIVEFLPRDLTKIVFSQGPYIALSQSRGHWAHVNGVVTCSEHNLDLMRFSGLSIPIANGRICIDKDIFHYEPSKRPLVISYMPRKNGDDIKVLMNLLASRQSAEGVEFVSIDNVNEGRVASILKDSAIFLNLATREGFGLPAAEAIACGCHVIGYVGGGGKEYFYEGGAIEVSEGDLMAFCTAIERKIGEFHSDPDGFEQRSASRSNYVLHKYSRDASRSSMAAAFSEVIGNLVK